MTIESTTSLAVSSNSSTSATASEALTVDYDSFLQLLTAQVQNQDPLEPMDSTTFVSQLAQLSQVEQSIVTNSNLEEINAKLAASGALSDLKLIGYEVTLADDAIELIDGSSVFQYQLDDNADSVTAQILDSDGNVVRELSGLAGTGDTPYTVTWDGTDDNGEQLADGTYTLKVEATDAEGDDFSAATYVTTMVNEVNYDTSASLLVLRNGSIVSSGQVIAVR